MNRNKHSEQRPLPWYRVGMVWLMIGLPTVVVIASIVTAVIAHKNAPEVTTQKLTQKI